MDKFNILVTDVPGVQVLQAFVPGKVALTSVRSLEVQDEAEGNVVVVCAKACEENKQAGRNRTIRRLMINSYQAFCLGDRSLARVKGWFITMLLSYK